jgi:ElaB/YqjD/DUF883 family membrane-anchored ribosome-binding protein
MSLNEAIETLRIVSSSAAEDAEKELEELQEKVAELEELQNTHADLDEGYNKLSMVMEDIQQSADSVLRETN